MAATAKTSADTIAVKVAESSIFDQVCIAGRVFNRGALPVKLPATTARELLRSTPHLQEA